MFSGESGAGKTESTKYILRFVNQKHIYLILGFATLIIPTSHRSSRHVLLSFNTEILCSLALLRSWNCSILKTSWDMYSKVGYIEAPLHTVLIMKLFFTENFFPLRYLTESWGSGDQGRIEQRIIEGAVLYLKFYFLAYKYKTLCRYLWQNGSCDDYYWRNDDLKDWSDDLQSSELENWIIIGIYLLLSWNILFLQVFMSAPQYHQTPP